MAIRADSWSSTTDVKSLVRHILDGETTFNSTTRPTNPEVEAFIDEASGLLNLALRTAGFDPATVKANSTATQAMDNWVRFKTVAFVNLVNPYQGWDGDDTNPARILMNLAGDAVDFISDYEQGLINIPSAQTVKASDGLQFTAIDAKSQRSDRSDTSLAQPKFERDQFDNTAGIR